MTGAGATSISGTYPNFTITSTDTDTVYTHPSAHSISFITGLQTALDGKVDDSQVLTNVPANALFTDTVYTLPSGYATETYVGNQITALVDSSPATMDTLNELAAALGMILILLLRYQLALGTKWTQDNTKISQWNTAYGWGNHASAGYLTSYTDTNTTYSAGTGISLSGTTFSLTDTNAKLNLSGGNLTGGLTGTTAAFDSIYLNSNDRIYGGTSYRAMEASSTGTQLQLGEGYGLINMFKTQNAVSELKLWNNRQDAGNIGVSKVSGYNGVEVANMTFYRGNGGSAGFIKFQTKPTNADVLADQFQIGDGNTAGYGVNVPIGGYRINGTTVIDPSRNLTNIGTISSGAISINGIDQPVVAQHDLPSSSGSWGGRIVSKNATTDVASFLGNYKGYAGVFAHSGALNAWAPIYINAHSGSGQANVYTGSLYVNGNNLAWHAGNDGSNSGLDADLLDGQQGSYYAPASHNHSGVYLPISDKAADSELLDGINSTGFVRQLADGTSPDYQTPSSRRVDPTTSNPTNAHHAIITFGNNDNVTGQLATHFVSGQAYTRGYNSSWSAWRKQWDSLNDGSGSGLDADTVDGIQGSQFLRSDANDTATGNISFNGQLYFNSNSGSNYTEGVRLNLSTGGWGGAVIGGIRNSINGISNAWWLARNPSQDFVIAFGTSADSGGLHLPSGTTALKYKNNAIYHSGNDGSGSGLDADLLDGLQPSALSVSYANTAGSAGSAAATNMSANRTDGTAYQILWGTSGTTSQLYSCAAVKIRSSDGTVFSTHYRGSGNVGGTGEASHHPAGIYSNGNNWLYGSIIGNGIAISGVNTLNGGTPWQSTNDGSGSGLDADTVDGIQGGSFLRSDADDTVGAGVTYTWSGTNTAGLVFQNATYGTYLHMGGWTSTNSNNISRIRTSSGNLHIDSAANGNLYLNQYSSGNTFISGNTAWHVGNDGGGSGLDADLLDGQQGSYYAPASHNHSGVYLPISGKAADSELLDGIDSARVVYASGTNAMGVSRVGFASLTNSRAGFYDVSNSGTPTGTWYSLVNMPHSSTNHGHQIAGSFYSAGDIYNRNNNNTNLSAWAKIWNTVNDGSGSGLDADLLDGQHGSYYYPASNPSGYTTNTGTLTQETVSSTNTVTITGTKYFRPAGTVTTPLSGSGNASLQVYSVGGNYAAYMAFHRSGHYAINWGLDTSNNMVLGGWSAHASIPSFKVVTSTRMAETGGQGVLWGAGNDGSGSGLDADLLDGLQPSALSVNYANTAGSATSAQQIDNWEFTNTGSNASVNADTIDSNGISYYNSGVSNFSGNSTDGALYSQRYSSIWQHQIAGDYRSGQIALRGKNNGTWQSWRKVWDGSNDGSGSGLDADLLDGLQLHAGRNNEVNKVVRTDVNGYIQAGWINTTSGATTGTNRIYASNDGYVRYVTPTTFRNNLGLWWTGNDGSGSGLDADLLDGVQGSGYVKTTGNQSISGVKTFTSTLAVSSGQKLTIKDGNHFLQYLSTGYSGVAIDGPILTGHQGGELTTNYGGNNYSLRWNRDGDITSRRRVYVQGSTTNFLGQGPYSSTNLAINCGNALFIYSGSTNLASFGTTSSAFNNQIIADKSAATTGTASATIISRGTVTTTSGYQPQNYHITFQNGGQVVKGSISSSHYATIYSTSSDYRLKEDLQPISNATERLLALNPVNFKWIDGQERSDGFIAHELQEHLPEAVTGEKDATTEVTETVVADDGTETEVTTTVPEMQGIDQSKLVPLLVKTIQELEARITALENA